MRLTKIVRRDSAIGESDTLQLKHALYQLGHYEMPNYGMTPYPDDRMFEGIKSFQQSLGLEPTGSVRIDGPEHMEMSRQLSGEAASSSGSGPVHVDAHTRHLGNKPIEVHQHYRSRPGGGHGAGGHIGHGGMGDVGEIEIGFGQPQTNFKTAFDAHDEDIEDAINTIPDVFMEQTEDAYGEARRAHELHQQIFEKVDYDPAAHQGDVWSGMKYGDVAVQARNKITGERNRGPIQQVADDATAKTKQVFGYNGRNDESDAFRHAYLSYKLSEKFGTDGAKEIGDGHEVAPEAVYRQKFKNWEEAIENGENPYGKDAYSSPERETAMDVYNNHVGRELYKKYGNSGRPAEEVVMEALDNGQLMIRPPTPLHSK